MNIYTEEYKNIVANYPREKMAVWRKTLTLALFNTPEDVGEFTKSDIIIVFNKKTHRPDIVTERIYRRKYSPIVWAKMYMLLLYKSHNISAELGFKYSVTFSPGYIDCCHFREEWWKWARKHLVSQ